MYIHMQSLITWFVLLGTDWSLMNSSASYSATCSLDIYSYIFLSPSIGGDMLSSDTLNPNPNSYIHMILNPYLKGNVIEFSPLN